MTEVKASQNDKQPADQTEKKVTKKEEEKKQENSK